MDQNQLTRFASLWTQAQTSIFAVISATVTNFADAEDVLQKVSTVAVKKFDQFDADGDAMAFVAWTIAIARFEILRHLRDRATDRHEFIAESLGQVVQAFEEIVPEMDERRESLADCIKHLTTRSRTVLKKRYGEGLKITVIADQLDLSASNVSVILNRTYGKLRDCVESRLSGIGGTQ